MLKETCLVFVGFALYVFSPWSNASLITIDGDPSDWVGVDYLITDPAGDDAPHPDLTGVKATNDIDYLYLMFEYANDWDALGGVFAWLDTDLDSSTGCSLDGIGAEYGFTFAPSSAGHGDFLGDARSCSYSNDFPVMDRASTASFIEASIPLETFRIISPEFIGFDLVHHNDKAGPARYLLDIGPD